MQHWPAGYQPEYREQAPTLVQIDEITGYALLEFGASWCGHCQAAMPLVKQVLSGSSIPHIKIADGKGKKTGRMFAVKLWPTLILLKDGKEIARAVRPASVADIRQLLKPANFC